MRPLLPFLALALAFLTGFQRSSAQDINATVAPNIGGSDNFVDIQNTSGGRLHFYSAPSPSAATMWRMNSSLTTGDQWPSVPNFAPDPGHSLNRLFQGEYLRVYPKNLAVNTVITIPFSYGPNSGPTHNIRVIVTTGAQVTNMVYLDPNPTAAAVVRWRVTFDVPVSGVTAANFAFHNPANITGLSFGSITPDTAQPSQNWTVSANTGTGNGLLGLRWIGMASELPPVPNSYSGPSYDFQFGPVVLADPVSVAINRNSTTTLSVSATLRGGGTPAYQWFSGPTGNPLVDTLISGATGSSYTPPTFTNTGAFPYYCRVSSGANHSYSAIATVTVVDPPQISTQPANQSVIYGQPASLSVTATGTALKYQWYRGTAPDTSQPVGQDSPSYTSPALTADTSYWVRISNAGPTVVNSSTAAITVSEQPSLTVTIASDVADNRDNQTSLREAVAYANSLGGARVITFAPALAGQTITLSQGWSGSGDSSALVVTGNLTLDGASVTPGVTLAGAAGLGKRLIFAPPGAVLTLSDLTLSGGQSPDYGGAVWSQGSLTVKRCTFTGNQAALEGGAVQSWGDSPLCLIENSTFTGNTAGYGSAVNAGAVQTTLRHLTITGEAGPYALFLWKTQALLQNCIVAGNAGNEIGLANGAAFQASSSHNLLGASSATGLTHGANGNRLNVLPAALRLGSLGHHGGRARSIPLLPGSVAIDAGTAIPGITADQRGLPRQASAPGGLMGRYYHIAPAANTTLLDPLSSLEAFVPATAVLTPRIDFGSGTDALPGDGSVLDRGGNGGNPYQGIGALLPATDNLAALWDGFISVPETATYRFTTRSDDGSVLLIDGQLVVNNNFFQGMLNLSGTIHLTAGLHAIRAAHFEGGGDAGMQVSWEQLDGSNPFPRRIIEPAALHFGSAPDIGAYEFAAYTAAATPVIAPGTGTYASSTPVGITTTSENAAIRYTTDGSLPSATHGTPYTGPISVGSTTTLRAVAYGPGWITSPLAAVIITIQTPLEAWRALHGLAADGSQDLATPAADGVANLLKYAFNLAPDAGDLATPRVDILAPGGAAGLPRIGRDGTGRLTVTFLRRKAATQPGITYTVETGDQLGALQPLELAGAVVESVDALWERVTVTDPATTDRRFGRVKVTADP